MTLGIKVPAKEAEGTRRRLLDAGVLRNDLRVASAGGDVVFPVTKAPEGLEAGDFEFEPRVVRPRDYTELLPEDLRSEAPRAHDVLGDIVIIKIPADLWDGRGEIGEALLGFHGARAVFHDRGVKGEFRTRDLERIAGDGGSETTVMENGVRLHIDPAAAYYSPRLGDERARIVALAEPGESVIDLFGGVAPQGVQLAKAGCRVTSVDLNPAACDLARRNAEANKVDVDVIDGDAGEVDLEPADRVIMNLPHGAKHFFVAAAPLVRPGGMLHHHEILRNDELEERKAAITQELADLGRAARITNIRHVRDYSTDEAHYAFDLELA